MESEPRQIRCESSVTRQRGFIYGPVMFYIRMVSRLLRVHLTDAVSLISVLAAVHCMLKQTHDELQEKQTDSVGI